MMMRGLRLAIAVKKKKEHDEQVKSEQRMQLIDNETVDIDGMFDTVSITERSRIMGLPQHFSNGDTNPEWLHARRHVMTGSKVAGLSGNGYNTSDQLLKHMLWPSTHSVNKIFCEYGNRNEAVCEQQLAKYLAARVKDPLDPLASYKIRHSGLVKDVNCFGYSPDGYVDETFVDGSAATVLAEYKCPFSKRRMRVRGCRGLHPYRPSSGLPDIYGPMRVPPAIPGERGCEDAACLPVKPCYYDQIQWGMGICLRQKILRTNAAHVPVMKCYFVVWTPAYSQVCTVPFDPPYAAYLQRLATDFMQRRYIPNLRSKLRGELALGAILSGPPVKIADGWHDQGKYDRHEADTREGDVAP